MVQGVAAIELPLMCSNVSTASGGADASSTKTRSCVNATKSASCSDKVARCRAKGAKSSVGIGGKDHRSPWQGTREQAFRRAEMVADTDLNSRSKSVTRMKLQDIIASIRPVESINFAQNYQSSSKSCLITNINVFENFLVPR